LGAAQGVDLRGGSAKLGKGTRAVHKLVRSQVPMLKKDRAFFRDVKEIVTLIQHGQLFDAIQPFLKASP